MQANQSQGQANGFPLQNMSNQPQPANDSNDEAKRAEEGTGNSVPSPPKLHSAQSTQNAKDEKARRQAAKDLAQSWMDRLQLISVITTFFASTEAGMLQVTGLGDAASVQVANAAFTGALVLHIWAAIISFLAAFFLVRYNLKEAKEEGSQAGLAPGADHSHDHDSPPHPGDKNHRSPPSDTSLKRPQTSQSLIQYSPLQPVWTMNPHLEQIGPFQRKPPTHLLSRCHNLCILLTFAGFLLALLGILAFAWGQNPVSVGVVTSVSTAVCAGGAIWVFL
ncbi:hypothetical protein C8F04DRAFT_1052908 [Mycena alexandri]|uniref:Transmembrane protein n=1 Tax=Mycena alexandri TaxID=1745969 RepID=A0AAD6S1V9_9AGAR|nr:hypothetical protein C8F04DRAFT_1052908 [Mycena alexandri]